MNNLFMHLTNYAINKNSDDFIFNEEESFDDVGHKRSLSAVLKQLEEEGNDPNLIMNRISDLIIKTIVTVQPSIAHAYKTLQPDDFENSMIFEILGFDILLDYKCRPWLLEVNSSPSFVTDTPLDRKIKKGLISDTFKLLNLSQGKSSIFIIERKYLYKKKQQDSLMERMRTGKQNKLSQEEKVIIKKQKEDDREKYETGNMGKYILLYPLNEKLKENLKSSAKANDEAKTIEMIPDQLILQDAIVEKRPAVNSEPLAEANQKLPKKNSSKDQIDDGDIYTKYLKKANTIWEDFTTGKKKPKEESPLKISKKTTVKKMKSLNASKAKQSEGEGKPQPNNLGKASSAVTHNTSVKKKIKKVVGSEGQDKIEHKRIIITSQPTIEEVLHEKKNLTDVESQSKKIPILEQKNNKNKAGLSKTGKSSQLDFQHFEVAKSTDRPYEVTQNQQITCTDKGSLSCNEKLTRKRHQNSIDKQPYFQK
jgi:hypothetical protein